MKGKRKQFPFAVVYLRALALLAFTLAGCGEGGENNNRSVQPRTMRDVPAERLTFNFYPDVGDESNVPAEVGEPEAEEKVDAIETDFETQRPSEELLRTVVSPDGQRALALYATSETYGSDFRMDLYSTSGAFIRNILPQDIVGTFADEVAWSPDGSQFAFLGIKNPTVSATPDPDRETSAPPVDPEAAPVTGPTVAPIIAPVPVYKTEQVYIADRDGLGLRPLTTRDGLIYFKLAWAPDGHALAALACREDEWNARKDKGETPGGRPRIISPGGEERLLDDRMADAAPVWSPDSSKVATAFDKTVAIYDSAGAQPTGANIPLEEPLWATSFEYDSKRVRKSADDNTDSSAGEGDAPREVPPVGSVILNSYNPIIRVVWPADEMIFVQTAYVRQFRDDPAPTVRYVRWHRIALIMPETQVSRAPYEKTVPRAVASGSNLPRPHLLATAHGTVRLLVSINSRIFGRRTDVNL